MTRCNHLWLQTDPLPVCARCGQQPTASPSQVETWRDCKRKWGYSRVRERGPNPAADYGTRCHTLLERWLLHGELPPNDTPEGRTVWTGLHLLPMPRSPGLALEERATPVLGGPQLALALGLADDALGPAVAWDMRKDFRYGLTADGVVIGDHKTTGDIAKYAKTSETLSTIDPQGVAYTHDCAEHYGVSWVVGQWVYYQRDAKAKAKAVTFQISRQQARERFAAMHVADVVPMVRARATPIDDLPRNLEACTKYGGCPYARECLATVSSQDRAMSALVQLRAAPAKEIDTMPDMPPDLLNAIAAAGGIPPAPTPTTTIAFVPGTHTTGNQQLDAYLAGLPESERGAAITAMQKAQAEAGKPVMTIAAVAADTRPVEAQAPKKRGRPAKPKAEAEVVVDATPDPVEEAATPDSTPEDHISRHDRQIVVCTWLQTDRPVEDLDAALARLGGTR